MKKLLAVVVVFVLILTMILPSAAMAAVDYSYIKVLLASMGSPTSVQFKFAGAYRVSGYSGIDLYPGVTYTMKTSGTGLKLSYNNGVGTVTASLPSSVTFVRYSNGSSSNFIYVNDPGSGYGWRYYAGDMTFKNVAGSASTRYIQLINTVFIETYLYGVIAYEMGDDWPLEALKAQAVCARTYAMRWIKSNSGDAYYLDDTSAYQVYRGYPFNSDGTAMSHVIAAVDTTRAQVITLPSGALADGMYSASNGGQINTLSMRYKNGVDTYHVFKDDPYDLANTASSKYVYYFPKSVSSLSASDKAKAKPILDLLLSKLPAALAAKGVNCTQDQITINGVDSAMPAVQRNGVPAGSKMFTQIAVTVNVTVNGAAAPVAAVSYSNNGSSVPIASGDGNPSAAEGTDFGSASVAAGNVSRTFTITNTGNAPLTISGITTNRGSSADFAVSSIPASVDAGSSKTFTVTFDPSAPGLRTTQLEIDSNDTASPYTFTLQGTGLNNGANITSFKFQGYDDYPGTITGSAITVNLPAGTDVSNLVAVFAADAGAAVKVGQAVQASGSTANDFSNAVLYAVTSEDGNTSQTYLVSVTTGATLAGAASGGGGMPATSATCDVTVNLVYLLQASDGDWDTLGELRKSPFSDSSTLLPNAAYLWLLYPDSDSTFLTVTARGYGHGVGLSQRGAQQMAKTIKSGTTCYSYSDILDFYFNISAGKSTLYTMSITEKPLSQIPGKGADATYGKVNSTTLNVRAAADAAGTLVGTLPKDTVVEYTATSTSGWYRILYASKGMVGYAMSKYLTKTSAPTPTATPTATVTPSSSATPSPTPSTSGPTASPSPTPTQTPSLGRVIASSLYIRSAPNASAAKIYQLSKNDVVTILDANAATNWYKVSYGSAIIGYSMYQDGATTYIEIVGAAPTANPSASATSTSGGGVLTPPTVSATANVSSGSYLTIRKSPSTTAGSAGQIPAGSSFTVLLVDTNALWLKIKYSGTTGYVLAKYAKIGGNTAYHACTITVSQLNVRSGASTGSSVIGTLQANDTLVVLATITVSSSEKWYKIKLAGSAVGYIDYRYARISKNS